MTDANQPNTGGNTITEQSASQSKPKHYQGSGREHKITVEVVKDLDPPSDDADLIRGGVYCCGTHAGARSRGTDG